MGKQAAVRESFPEETGKQQVSLQHLEKGVKQRNQDVNGNFGKPPTRLAGAQDIYFLKAKTEIFGESLKRLMLNNACQVNAPPTPAKYKRLLSLLMIFIEFRP